MVAESTAGIIPGNRGKVGGNWCHLPLRATRAPRHISPVPLAGVVSGQLTHELGTERQGAIRNRVRAESGPPGVSTGALTQLPQRVVVATAQTRTQLRFPVGPPHQKASSAARTRRARETRPRGRSGSGKVRETSSMGRPRKASSPYCKSESSLRVKRSDP